MTNSINYQALEYELSLSIGLMRSAFNSLDNILERHYEGDYAFYFCSCNAIERLLKIIAILTHYKTNFTNPKYAKAKQQEELKKLLKGTYGHNIKKMYEDLIRVIEKQNTLTPEVEALLKSLNETLELACKNENVTFVKNDTSINFKDSIIIDISDFATKNRYRNIDNLTNNSITQENLYQKPILRHLINNKNVNSDGWITENIPDKVKASLKQVILEISNEICNKLFSYKELESNQNCKDILDLFNIWINQKSNELISKLDQSKQI